MNKRSLIIVYLLFISVSSSGCWDYREVNNLSIVTGAAVDRGENHKYKVTFEIVDLHEAGPESKIKSKLIESEGETFFEAIRNVLKITSPRPYFGHMGIVIISEQVAREGVIDIIDFLNRDAEPRLNIDLLVSKEKTANEILSTESTTTAIRSFEIEQMLNAIKIYPKSPRVRVYQFVNDLPCEGIVPVLPTMLVVESDGNRTSALSGAAVFKDDKMVGYINEEESNYYSYIMNNVKRGIFVLKDNPELKGVSITLEIYDTETKVKPVYSNGKVSMDIIMKVRTSLAQLGEYENSKSENEIDVQRIQNSAEKYIETKTATTIQSIQRKIGLDIFGFGKKVHSEMPELWRKIRSDWNMIYKDMDVNVSASVEVKNEGMLRHPVKVGK